MRLVLAALMLLAPAASFGQEVILTPQAEATAPQTAEDEKRQAMGDWARGVIERAATGEAPPPEVAESDARGCLPPLDRKPHGVVWGEVGTGGYTNVGVVVTQPVGECGQVTVGVSRSEGGRGYRRRR